MKITLSRMTRLIRPNNTCDESIALWQLAQGETLDTQYAKSIHGIHDLPAAIETLKSTNGFQIIRMDYDDEDWKAWRMDTSKQTVRKAHYLLIVLYGFIDPEMNSRLYLYKGGSTKNEK